MRVLSGVAERQVVVKAADVGPELTDSGHFVCSLSVVSRPTWEMGATTGIVLAGQVD